MQETRKSVSVRTALGTESDVFQAESIGPSFSLTVLVPVYNERYLVESSLRRLLALKDDIIHSLEVIVVDDHSTDGSWEILQQI